MDQREWDYGARLPRDRRAAESWSLEDGPESPDLPVPTPKWQSITDTGSLEPSPEALAWAQRADQWAQQPNLPERRGGQDEGGQVSRWSEVVPTGTTPADGVGWRTETAEWRATSARWRQTTEWRSSSGTHGWRSTTEAWQTGEAGAEGFPPPAAPPTGGPLAISSGLRTGDEQADSYQQDDGSYRTESYNPPGEARGPAGGGWQPSTQPATPWQQPAPAPPWQQGAPSPPPWESQAGAPWQQFTTPGDGQHLVREDDRAQWRQSAAGAAGLEERSRQIGRRRAADAGGTRAGGGDGWSARSEADNWAGHTDTGSMPLFQDPALGAWQHTPEQPSWRTDSRTTGEAPDWRTDSRTTGEAPDWRTDRRTSSEAPDWHARLEAAEWQEPDSAGWRTQPETTDWRTRTEAPDWRREPPGAPAENWRDAPEPPPPAQDNWRTRSITPGWRGDTPATRGDADVPAWRTESRTNGEAPDWRTADPRTADPRTAASAEAPDWRAADQRAANPRTASAAEAPDWRTDRRRREDPRPEGAPGEVPGRRAEEPDRDTPDWRTQTGAAPWGPQDAGRRGTAADNWREPRDDTGATDWRSSTSTSDWRTEADDEPRSRAAAEAPDWRPDRPETDNWRDPEAPPRRAIEADNWRDAEASPRRATETDNWREPEARPRRGPAPEAPQRREQEDWRRQGPAADPWAAQSAAAEGWQQPEPDSWDTPQRAEPYQPYGRRPAIEPPPRRRAEIEAPADDEDDDPRGSRPVSPELWQGAEQPQPDRQNWRMEPLDDPRTPSWRRELQDGLEPPVGEAATEIRQAIDWQGGRDGGEVPGSATYREGSTGDWRRNLAAESALADGESRRFGTSDFVPFKASGTASVSASRPVAEPVSAGQTGTGRWQDPPDTQWPPRAAVGYDTASTGSYERRPVSTLPSTSGRQNNLLEPDEDEIEESTGGPLAAVGYTVIWYGVPVVLFVLYMLVLSGSQQAHALSTLAGAAPQFGLSLVLSMLVAVGLRWASGSWKAANVGLAAAVVGGGLATVLTSAITGNSLS